MLTVKGKFNEAHIFTDVVDEASIAQVIELCNQEFTTGSQIRLMPDIHAGAGCTVGTTMTITDKIVPNLVGVDIGCGMRVAILKETHIEPQQLDKVIQQYIPAGFAIRGTVHPFAQKMDLRALRCIKEINLDRAEKSVGTLGGGNHFIEANQDDEGTIYLVVHSGSRHLGLEVANHYQRIAYEQCNHSGDTETAQLIAQLKAEGKTNQIEAAVRKLKNTKQTNIPKQLTYVSGSAMDDYLHDMMIVQQFAEMNRAAIADVIVKKMGLHIRDEFSTIHNYIDLHSMILRKGAVSARAGERLLIPINMRDGSLLCTGKGNEAWNYSAPHGAGRLMSRSVAKSTFTVSEFKNQMTGIYTTSVGRDTLDECPMAYKNMDDIINNVADTVSIDNP